MPEEEYEDLEKEVLKTTENAVIQEDDFNPNNDDYVPTSMNTDKNSHVMPCEYTNEVLDSAPMSIAASNGSNNSSRNSTLSSFNWIRRSFEDLELEVLQTEIMQTRKRKDSKSKQNPFVERRSRRHAHSFSSSTNSEDFQTDISSKVMPYCKEDADDCIECRHMFGQVIDDDPVMMKRRDTQIYPCDCPIVDIPCCENCCSVRSSSPMHHEKDEILTVSHEKSFLLYVILIYSNYYNPGLQYLRTTSFLFGFL